MTDASMKALEELLNEASAAIADLVDAVKSRGEEDGAISQALADILAVMQKREAPKAADMEPIAAAIRALRELPAPQVNVTVTPNLSLRSALADGGVIEMRMPAPAGGRDKVVHIRLLAPQPK